uniref:Uncharacterized protein n=1 Tax=Arundo donax TaxID=35708 RepID=A0A0A9D5U8_ARUDO
MTCHHIEEMFAFLQKAHVITCRKYAEKCDVIRIDLSLFHTLKCFNSILTETVECISMNHCIPGHYISASHPIKNGLGTNHFTTFAIYANK